MKHFIEDKLAKQYCHLDISRSKQWVLWEIERLINDSDIDGAKAAIKRHLNRYSEELKAAGDYTPVALG